MTKAAKKFKKRPNDFMALPSTTEYLTAFEGVTGISGNALHCAKRGGRKGESGTWFHPKLGVFFARWLDAEFAVWCDLMIDNILKGNIQTTVVVPTVTHQCNQCSAIWYPVADSNYLIINVKYPPVHRTNKYVQWRLFQPPEPEQDTHTMSLELNFGRTFELELSLRGAYIQVGNLSAFLCRDYVTRVQPRPWFRIEKQEHAEGWEVLMGNTLLVIAKEDALRTA